ncbi:plc-like phosphodiesterase [Malassezia pachydermatis]|uniref:Plc-like phosphodiesterase n=1 Tax=Malassezia pachydermatis TaxID=77020 RepID=A0A0N0RSH5_9BASI|nr:plc-like phosphodiesterase [Malassezia pachydermatis]KOS15229.1 plc-like phosphodiesterase [Malassezia pachydermatis]
MSSPQREMPECWGHRGASAEFPENTLRSFAQAIKDGSEGIESDVHITADDVIVMFHDTTLDRTTNSTGLISARQYYGKDGLEHVHTLKEPPQQIPTFEQLCSLLMQPSNRHVKLNIDIKPNNDPERLFSIMNKVVSKFPHYETELAPRLILGLWHPKFIAPAKQYVPSLRRAHIGASPADALKYFWKDCDAFSIHFASLVNREGQDFIQRAHKENKDVMVWTVNRKDEMVSATSWGVSAILTDYTADLQNLRKEMKADFDSTYKKYVSPMFGWGTGRYYTPYNQMYKYYCRSEVEQHAGL